MRPEDQKSAFNPISQGMPSNPGSSLITPQTSPFNDKPVPKPIVEPKLQALEGFLPPDLSDLGTAPPPTEKFTYTYKGPILVALLVVFLAPVSLSIYGYLNKSKIETNKAATANVLNPGQDISKLQINRDTLVGEGKKLTATGQVAIQNETDSSAAFLIQDASGSTLLVADTSNHKVGIATAPTGSAALQVGGDISDSGSLVSSTGSYSLGPEGLKIGPTLVCTITGCINPQTQLLAGLDLKHLAFTNVGQTFSGSNIFSSKIGIANTSPVYALDVNGDINTTGRLRINGIALSSANLSDSGQIAYLSTNNNFTGSNAFSGVTSQTGNYLFQSATNSLTAFQLQNAAGNDNLLIADTINTRIGIGMQPNYTLDVNGDVNVAAGHTFRINGTDVCSGGLCNPSSGSSFYIQNTNLTQAGANFNVQSANATYVGGIIQGANGQTADLLEGKTSAGTTVFALDPSGNVNITGNYMINGSTLCGVGGCTPSSGSGAYIQNGTVLQVGANFNIESTNINNVTGILKGKTGQAVDIFQVKDGAGNAVLTVGNQGQTLLKDSSAGSATFFQLENSGGLSLLTANTTTGQVLFPNATLSSSALLLGGDANLYRSVASTLKTDGGLVVAGGLTVNGAGLFNPTSSSTTPLAIKGAAGQTADLFQAQNSSGTVLDAFDKNGLLRVGATGINYSTSGIPLISGQSSAGTGIALRGFNNNGASDLFLETQTNPGAQITGIYATGAIVTNLGGNANLGTAVGLTVKESSVQTADLLQLLNSSGTVLSSFNSAGALTINNQASSQYGVSLRSGGLTNYTAFGLGRTSNEGSLGVAGSGGAFAGGAQPGDIILRADNQTNQLILSAGTQNGAITIGASNTAGTLVQAPSATPASQVVFGIKGAASQTADLFQVQDSSGTVLDKFSNTGGLTVGSNGLGAINAGTIQATGGNVNLFLSAGGTGYVAQAINGVAQTQLSSSGFLVQPSTNSATAFQVQNAAGQALLVASTSAQQVAVGPMAVPANGVLTIGTNTTTAPGGIYFGTDTNLYRSAVGDLKTDGIFEVSGALYPYSGITIYRPASGNNAIDIAVNGDTQKRFTVTANGNFSWGSGSAVQDTNLYRSGAGVLETDNNLLVKTITNSATAFQIQNSTGSSLLTVDSLNSNISTVQTVTGGLAAWSTNANPLPTALEGIASATANGYVYVLGGTTSGCTDTASVYYAKLNSDGSTGSWQAANSLISPRAYGSAVVINGYIYYLGGNNNSCGAQNSTVFYAKLNSDGSLGSWTTTTSMPGAEAQMATATMNGYVYVMGDGGRSTAVYYAKTNPDGTISSWSTSPNTLPVALQLLSGAAANSYIYVIGGDSAGGVSSAVYYAKVNPADGSVGSWTTSSNSLPGTVNYNSNTLPVTSNGYVYVIGSSNGPSSTIYYSKLNSDGTTGVWQTNSNSLPASRYISPGEVTYNGYVYVLGGDNSGAQSTVYYASAQQIVRNSGQASIANQLTVGNGLAVTGNTLLQPVVDSTAAFQVQNSTGGSLINVDSVNNALSLLGNTSGQLSSWTTNTNSLPAAVNGQASIVANGFVYSIGHGTSIYYAKLNADGSTGTWQTNINSLPSSRTWASAVTVNNYLYVIGGDNSTPQSTVYYAKLNSDGNTSTWQNTTALPTATECHSSITANGYIYVIAGDISNGCGSATTTVYYAKLNADGTLGSWSTTTSTTSAVDRSSAVVANGYVYLVGAISGGVSSNVWYAPINGNGTLGSWSPGTALPQALQFKSAIVSDGYLYTLGGDNGVGGNPASSVAYLAKISSNGSVGSWQTSSNNLPAGRGCGSAVSANGYIYYLGGETNVGCGGSSATVYYASTSRVQLGANLDLVGLQGGTLSDPGSQSFGSVGGSLSAGNGLFVGSLQVQGAGSFAQGVVAAGNFTNTGSALFQNSTDSTAAFQIQNASGTTQMSVDTTNSRVNIGNDTVGGSVAKLNVLGGLYDSVNGYKFNLKVDDTSAAGQGVGGGIGFGGQADADRTFAVIQGYHESATSTDYAGALGFYTRPSGSAQLKKVLGLSSSGAASFQNSTDSSNAFQIQNASGVILFNVDAAGSVITLGPAGATPVILVLGNKNTSGDPGTCTSGGIYYNSNSNQFRGCANGTWTSFGNLHPSTRAYDSTTQTVPNITNTTLTFDSERWDQGNLHDTVTNPSRITIATPGKYHINGNIEWPTAGGSRRILWIRLNGTTVIAQTETDLPASQTITQNISTEWNFAANDYVELLGYQDSGGTLTIPASTGYQAEFSATWDSE